MDNKKSYWEKKSKNIERYGAVQQPKSFSIFSKLFFWKNKITTSNNSINIKKINWVYVIFGGMFLGLLIWGFSIFTPGLTSFGGETITDNIAKIFKFKNASDNYIDHNIWTVSGNAIIETIKISIIGTILGVILSIPTSFLSSRNLMPSYVNKPIRMIMAFFRTLPPLIFALIFASGFSPTFAATLTLMFFTWATLNKLIYEEIENTSLDAYSSLVSGGVSKIVAFKQTILKAIIPKFTSLALYSFEINLRISAILGLIGGMGGIGNVMNNFIASGKFENLGIPVVLLIVTIIGIEFLSTLIRIFLFEKSNNRLNASAFENYANERTYYINFIQEKYNQKIKKSNNKATILDLRRKLSIKILKIKNKYSLLDSKIINSVKKEEILKIKKSFQEKRLNINRAYSKRIKKAELAKRQKTLLKLKDVQTELLLNLELKEKKEIRIIENALNVSQRVLFVNKKSPTDWIFKLIAGILLVSVLWWSASAMSWHQLSDSHFGKNISYIIKPNMHIFGQAFSETLESTLIAFIATVLGGFLAFFVGMLASRKITSIFIAPIFQLLIIIIRVIPAFVVAAILVPGLIDARFAAVLALGLHSVGMLGKLVREQFENIDTGPLQSIKTAGGNKIEEIRYGIFPQVMPNILSVIIYRFEINIKSMTEVGFILTGISDMGWNLKMHLVNGRDSPQEYASAYSYIYSLVITILVIEFFSNIIRSYLVSGLLPPWLYRIKKHWNRKQVMKNSIFLYSLQYNTALLSGSEINMFASLEKQCQLDQKIDVMFFKHKSYQQLVKTNEKIFELKNKLQFSLIENKEKLLLEIKSLIENSKKYKLELKNERKINRKQIHKYEWENILNLYDLNKKLKQEYKVIYKKYKLNIQKTIQKSKKMVIKANNNLKQAKQAKDRLNIHAKKQELKIARKVKDTSIKLAKKTPISNFFLV